jgi:transcriptional regulator with XRE-family HTH domain
MTRSVFLHSYGVLTQCLVDARVAAGVTQVELAERLGRPQSFVSKVEGGDRRLDVIEFLQITTALNVQPEPIIRILLDATVDDQPPVLKR